MNQNLLTPEEFQDEIEDLVLGFQEDAIRLASPIPGGGTRDPDYRLSERMYCLISQWQGMYKKLHPDRSYYSTDMTESEQPPKD